MARLSKSIYICLIVDILILLGSAYLTGSIFNIPTNTIITAAILYTCFAVYVLFLKGYYHIRKYDFFLKDAYHLLEGMLLAAVISGIILLFFYFSRSFFNFLLTYFGFSYIFLLVWRSAVYTYRKDFKKEKNILIIGAGNQGDKLSKEILERPELKFNITGFIDNDENKLNTELNGIKVIGKTSDLKEIIDKNDIKIVVIAISAKLEHQVLMDISECIPQGIDVYKMTYLYEKIAQKVPVQIINPDWFMYNFTTLERPLYGFLKRLFDVAAATIILLEAVSKIKNSFLFFRTLLSASVKTPKTYRFRRFLLLIGRNLKNLKFKKFEFLRLLLVTFPTLVIIVKLYDGGNAMYFQDRVGKNGKLFKLYKSRTICQNADKAGMVDKGNTEDDRIRHWITPGWTGRAQINQGHCVNVDDIIKKTRYDFFYIKNRNIFRDISILLKAVGLALSGKHG